MTPLHRRLRAGVLVTVFLLGLVAVRAGAQGYPTAEAYTRYLTNDPWDETPAWSETVPQGLAHDDRHWYISQKGRLWAIDRSVDLGSVSGNGPGVYSTGHSTHPLLAGYEHYSDIDFVDVVQVPGAGAATGRYVVMAAEGSGMCGAVALFTAYDPASPATSLRDVARTCIPYNGPKAPWVAVDAKGFVYAGRFDGVSRLGRYVVDWRWDFAATEVVPIQCEAEPADPETATHCGSGIDLRDGNGVPMSLDGVQGVAFSESGEVVYVSTLHHGIHVFRSSDGRLLERSCNAPYSAESCRFAFQFDDDFAFGLEQEPEGLTVWDLEEATDLGGNTRGSLHVLLVDKTAFAGEHVYIKHYSGRVFVGEGSGDGRFASPYGSLEEALPAIWPGGRLVLRGPDTHPGARRIDTRIQLESRGGPVTLRP